MTEQNVIDAIEKLIAEASQRITLKPTQLLYRPADIEALGLTHEDVVRLIQEKNT